MAKVVLADIKGRDGVVEKDTMLGGFGRRFKGLSTTMLWIEWVRRFFQSVPIIQMAYLASIFRRAGHSVVFTDGEVPEGDMAIVLSSIVDYRNECYWARKFKAKNPNSPVGFIGPTATHLPKLFMNSSDFIIQGEPEQACMDRAKSLDFHGIIKSEEISNLDLLPFPDWDIINVKAKYPFPGTMRTMELKVITMVTSRSCTETCIYCPHRIMGSCRFQSIERVMEEIINNYKKYGSHYIIFRDSNFTRYKDRLNQFIEEMSRLNLNIYFELETRLDELEPALLDRLKSIGLRRIHMGIESVNLDTLASLGRRPISFDKQKEIIEYCQKIGIMTQGCYMFGFPDDTIKSIVETTRYSLSLGTNMTTYKVVTPFPGTPFYEQIKDKIFEKDWEKFDGFYLTFHHKNITPQEMKFLIENAYARFYSRPSQYFRYKGTYEKNKVLADRLDAWADKKHEESMLKTLLEENIYKEDFLWV